MSVASGRTTGDTQDTRSHGAGRRAGRRAATLLVPVLAVTTLAACTAEEVDPARAGTVVVSVDLPFASLNGATAAGRAPGSVLVRGLVQSGFSAIEPDGTVRPDESFGTVEKVGDDPLTVRYTIAPTARWSDGVPVTPADLLLEWAARSGQLDEVVPELDADGVVAHTRDDVVVFGAASAALARAASVPTVEGDTVTVVYDAPVADWRTALDVNLPAHVLGRLALDPDAPALPIPGATPSATATGTTSPSAQAAADATATTSPSPVAAASASPSGDADPDATPEPAGERDDAGAGEELEEAAGWAQAVVTAVQQQDRSALVPISRVWRAAGRAGDVTADPTLTTTTGPYVLADVGGAGVEMVRNERYAGEAPAAYDRVRVRTDLDPLAQLDALAADEVDVAAPVSTSDVLAAAEGLEDVAIATGGDAVLQLVLQQDAGGVFDPGSYQDAPDPAATVAALRAAFLVSVPREEVVVDAVRPLWARAQVSEVVAAQVAPAATPTPVASATAAAAADGPVEVRVLTNTADPLRAAVLDALTTAAAEQGFEVVPVATADAAQSLRTRPEDWDAALVPVAQEDLPVAAFAARWRSGGATNVTGHADPALDEVLDALVAQPDPDAAGAQVADASAALRTWGAVLPVVRTPVLTVSATRDAAEDRGLPVVADVPVLTPAAADLTWWWNWTRR
ncbi:extracellular solute-binding protein family 5 [Cellulomonas flavigena DSM 20109]|uniref:Extracellular solute-binding protein family 5 n=1 Tax=Cellulomonas flavigena (strain ATCC 482 / DSM 20109 / BCRC 11376 / JCM 18109 / NBRC 3775 / NCIMB 8073 / NRS 134) TaxID=446466 RepID=D5UKS4_CELFN|nr:ABC transporter substrate-binding protein [Cellulomonas flavigena]ADG73892.1 extracellular solute-binding protein family 5 [Cellulomonas flavigena DSM 20109]